MLQISFADLYTSEAERVLRARARADGAEDEVRSLVMAERRWN